MLCILYAFFQFFDPNNERYEVPEKVVSIPTPTEPAQNPLYDVTFTNDPVFAFQVVRRSTGEILYVDFTIPSKYQFHNNFSSISMFYVIL